MRGECKVNKNGMGVERSGGEESGTGWKEEGKWK